MYSIARIIKKEAVNMNTQVHTDCADLSVRCSFCPSRNKSLKNASDTSDKGFSLVEVVVSMAILAILTLTLLNYFSNSVRYNSKMSRNQKATLLAQEMMEELKAQDTLIQKKAGTDEYSVPYLLDKNFNVAENTLNTEDSITGKIKGTGKIKLIGEADNIGKNYDEVITLSTEKKAQDKSNKECGYNNANSVMAVDNGQDDEAFAHFKMKYMAECDNKNVSASLNDEDIRERMQREIVIEIDNNPTDANIVGVKYKYSYKAKAGDSPSYSVPDYEVYVIRKQRVMKKNDEIELYLLYHTFNENDSLSVDKSKLTTPFNTSYGFHLLCQNKKSTGNKIKLNTLDNDNTLDNTIYTNLDSSDIVGVSTQINNEEDKLNISSVNIADITIEVYEKGKAKESGAKPYLTISGTKGEMP